MTVAGAAVLPALSAGQQAPPPTGSAPATTPEKKPLESAGSEKKLSSVEQAELDSKFNRIVNTYGPRLSTDQRQEVRAQLNDQIKALGSIRAAVIDNSVQPATVLKISGKV